MTIKNYYTKLPQSGKKPKQVIVLLHGYGSNGQDLASLAPYWNKHAPDAVFISPDAPFPCEMGGGGFQWFSLAERTPEKYLEGAKMAQPILDEFLDSILAQYGLTDKDLLLVGFSQGTMMSLYNGLRRSNKVAGILGYSGALIGHDELTPAHKPPVHLIHGEADDVVEIDRYHHAVKNLKDTGFTVTGHSTAGLTHSINEKGIDSGAKFIKSCF